MPEAVAAAFADAEFARLFAAAVGFAVQSYRIRRQSERLVTGIEGLGHLGDAAIVRSRWPERRAKTAAAAELFTSALVAAATSASPRLAAVYRERRLSVLLAALVAFSALYALDGDLDAALAQLEDLAPGSLAHLPGNPISIISHGADGSLVLDIPATATRRDQLDIDSYRASFRPEGQRGRPKGKLKPTGSGRRTIPEGAARDSLSMTLPGWAARWAPDLDLADPRQLHRARGRLASARQRGRLLGFT